MNRTRLWIAAFVLTATMTTGFGLTLRVVRAEEGDPFACNCAHKSGLRCDCNNGDVTTGGGCCCAYECSVITE